MIYISSEMVEGHFRGFIGWTGEDRSVHLPTKRKRKKWNVSGHKPYLVLYLYIIATLTMSFQRVFNFVVNHWNKLLTELKKQQINWIKRNKIYTRL